MSGNSEVRKSFPRTVPFPEEVKSKALVVDDETDVWCLMNNILKQRNIQAEFAGSLAEAEKLLSSDPGYSIIFLDNHLPDGFGVSLISRLKQHFPQMRLIMMTAYDTRNDKENAVRNGVDYFIGKPFSKDIILNTLDKLTA